MTTEKKDLVEIIEANPGCHFVVDNDTWWCNPAPPKPIEEMTDQEIDQWRCTTIADDETVIRRGSGYGSGCSYGGDILQALAVIAGVTIESV